MGATCNTDLKVETCVRELYWQVYEETGTFRYHLWEGKFGNPCDNIEHNLKGTITLTLKFFLWKLSSCIYMCAKTYGQGIPLHHGCNNKD